MNCTREQTHDFFRAFTAKILKTNKDIAICPPFTSLAIAREYADEMGFTVGAQNFCPASKGGQTGEISAEMLNELGVRMVIVGHSERRTKFGETDAFVTEKVNAALDAGLTPVLCVSEEYKTQLKSFKPGCMVAFEPVAAIGTGKPATAEQIAAAHAAIKKIAGADTPVLYGGSVNEKNAGEILKIVGVDGLLVGGAALCPDKFAAIINC
jgi:triosephosphate isomerase